MQDMNLFGTTKDEEKEVTNPEDLEDVKQNGFAIQLVKHQTPELCFVAVKEDGRALKYIKKQTPEICMEAVKQNWKALKFVHHQTPEICIAAQA